MLRLRCLGSFQLTIDKQAVALPTRKTAALLVYLALHPGVHTREQVVARFWGDSGEEEARRSLRTALTALRKTLGDACLLADRETVQLNPAYPLWIDVAALRQQQTLAPSQLDLSLYRGDFLEGFYDEWILRERDKLRHLYLQLLLRQAQHWRTQGDYAQTIATAQRILALDPAEETAHQHLLFCYMVAGDRQAARQQYEACVRALREELAVEPAPETVALYRRSQQAHSPTRAAAAAQSNLPLPLSSFIGRTQEIAKLHTLLVGNRTNGGQALARLVTIAGPGGCGKTRLAIQVARAVLDHFADGVWWVELAALRDDSQAPQALAQVLDVQQGAQSSLIEVLITNLRAKQALVVLDNCEHLLAACAELAEQLLRHCPQLQILATSRETLGIFGETSWLVPSLTVPAAPLAAVAEYLQFEAIHLFVERAAAVHRAFTLTPANAPAILQICRQLDGIPLAIELAAVRVKLLTVEQLAARLTGVIGARFDLLTEGSRTVLPRQQTLRATIEWSYALLSEQEQRLLQQLAFFAGGWSLEAAEAVGGMDGQPPVETLLAHLVNKSLVLTEPQGDTMRYGMLETVRQYAYEQLEKTGATVVVRDRNLAYFLALAEEAAQHLRSPDQAIWLTRLANEHDNLRAALAWALARQPPTSSARLGIALWRFWYIRGYYAEGCEWLDKLLGVVDQPEPRAWLLYGQGMLARRRDDSTMAADCFTASLALFRTLGHARGRASALRGLGFIHFVQGDHSGARPIFAEALALFRDLGDQEGIAVTLDNLAYITSDPSEEERLYQESLALRRRSGNLHGITTSLAGLAYCAISQENYTLARRYMQEHLQINEALGNQDGISNAYFILGRIAFAEGDDRAAQLLYEKSLKLCQETGNRSLLAAPTWGMGLIALKHYDFDRAHSLFAQTLLLHQEAGRLPDICEALGRFAALAMAQGQARRALALCGAATALRKPELLDPLSKEQQEVEQMMAVARQWLGQEAAARAWAAGQAMTVEQAVAYAIDAVDR